MKIGIIGSKGLLGSTLMDLCPDAVGTTHEQLDVTNEDAVMRWVQTSGCTHLINCTAYSNVDRAEVEVEQAYAVNEKGPLHLGRAAQRHGLRLIHLSTDYVFDGKKRTPYTEDDTCHPLGIYGKSKRAGEEGLLTEMPSALIIRTSWLFGFGRGKNFLSILLEKLLTEPELKIDASQTSRATYVLDLAELLMELKDANGLFHFATGEPITRYAFAEKLLAKAKSAGLPVKCHTLIPFTFTAPAPRPVYSALATDKIEKLTRVRTTDEVIEDYVCSNVCL